jgi:hypothetical protein
MKSVFVVQHENPHTEDVKFIGAFSSFETAQAAIKEVSQSKGFIDLKKSFFIDEYKIDEIHWKEGFVTMITQEVRAPKD